MEYRTPLEMLYHWEKTAPDRVFLRQPIAGQYHEFDWKRIADEVRRMASAIHSWNLPPQSNIAIASKNCAHWILSDLAIWMAGHVSVPLYPNLAKDTVQAILNHSGTRAVFLGKLDNWKPYVDGMSAELPVVRFPYDGPPGYAIWDDVVKRHEPFRGNPPRSNDEVATIIYTSGTTGTPKGVVHKFRSFSYSGSRILETIPFQPNDKLFSYLPLAHVAERILTETVGLYSGGSISFVESLELFGKNLADVQPTVFLGVPRIWEKFREGILSKMPQEKLDRLLGIPILSWVVRRKIQKALGLSRAGHTLSGAAPIAPSLIEWFGKLGIRIQEAYGLTENFAYSHYNFRDRIRVGTVGQTWPGVETKIGEGGEILMRSPCVMEGYYKAPELTREVLKDGWLHTGDQGKIDQDGYLKITGRVKELFKTAKGKYVAPSPIELRLVGCAHIEQACVVGQGMPAPLAIVTRSESARAVANDILSTSLAAHMKEINGSLDPHERLGRVIVVEESWTVENGFLTPTMKLKRAIIEERYGARVSTWASLKDEVIFADEDTDTARRRA